MSLYSPDFIFIFLPCFVALSSFVKGRVRDAFLLAGSIAFYFLASGKSIWFVLLLFSLAVLNYLLGYLIGILGGAARRAVFTAGTAFNALFLLSPKVLGMLTEVSAAFSVVSFAAPIGFSFYMFKCMSYLRQVYDRRIRAESSFFAVGSYLMLFSQILSGPIQTYSDYRAQSDRGRITAVMVNAGLYEFIIGLALKILLADRIVRVWTAGMYGISAIGTDAASTPLAWLGFFAYPLYLYFEFYGYSLMSRGVGRMLGYETPDNFTHPYMSRSVSEFWRRWHITLGQWFKDNVYFPLGGSRCTRARTVFNLFVVWLLTGVWHALCFDGSGVNFLLWAGMLFVFILLEKFTPLRRITEAPILSHVYLPTVILFSWVLFNTFIPTLSGLGSYFARLFPFFGETPEYVSSTDVLFHLGDSLPYMLAGILFLTPLPRRIYERLKEKHFIIVPIMLVLFWMSVYFIFRDGANPMVY